MVRIEERKQDLKGHIIISGRPIDENGAPTGEWKTLVDKDNLIVTVGKTLVRDHLKGDSTTTLASFAFGTGTGTPVAGDTDLGTAIAYSGSNKYKAYLEVVNESATSTRYTGNFGTGEPVVQPVDLTEVGLFTTTGTSGGLMYCRATFDAITKTSTLELRLDYILSF